MPDAMAIHNDGLDYSYFSVVTFGSKGQEMWMLLDTGAANTWVMGTDCTTDACQVHNTFGREDSATYVVTEDEWDVVYGSGSVEGVIIEDSMSFAGFDLTLQFGSATNTSDDFLHYPMDGIMGLGLSSPDAKVPTVMKAMMKEELLKNNILGINLQRHSDGARDGQITFGAIDKSKFEGEITYTDIIPDVHRWEIPIEDTEVDGNPANFKGKSAIVDTGTSFMLLPPEDAKVIHSFIPDAVQDGEDFKVPCSTKALIEISISGVKYTVSHKDYVGRADKTGQMCRSNIAGHQAFGKDQWLLGDVFLKNVYSVFDFDKNRIGMYFVQPPVLCKVYLLTRDPGLATRKYSKAPSPTTSTPTSSATLSPHTPSNPDSADLDDPNNSKDTEDNDESDKSDSDVEEQGNAAFGLSAPLNPILFSALASASWLMFEF